MKKLSHALILDDHQLFADAFSLVLEKYSLFKIVQTFNEVSQFIDYLIKFGNQEICIFLDYYLSEESGLSVMSEIKRLNKKAVIVFITSASSPSIVQNILKYKPNAILSKSSGVHTIISFLNQADRKSIFLDQFIKNILDIQNPAAISFTPREIELLRYFANGESISETAARTFLSPHTIIAHRRKMMAKTHCHSIGQLIKFAQDNDVI